MRRITLKDGPLDGKSYDVPDNADRIPADGGSYRLTPKTGQWEATKAAKPAQARAPRKRETKPKRARVTENTVETVDESGTPDASYSHVTPTVADGAPVEAGQQIGTIGEEQS